MWAIEIVYRYNNIVNRLMFDTKEQAEAERDKLAPKLGTEDSVLKNKFESEVVRLVDKSGTLDVVVNDVKSLRCYDIEIWNEDYLDVDIRARQKLRDAGVDQAKIR